LTFELPEDNETEILRRIAPCVRRRISIRELASLIGLLNFAFQTLVYCRVYLKNLERLKHQALLSHDGNFDAKVFLPHDLLRDLDWGNLHITAPIRSAPFCLGIFSDASVSG